MKRVMVIDIGDDADIEGLVLQLQSMSIPQAKRFLENSALPGPLLASFEVEVMYNTKRGELEINLPFEVQDKLMSNKVNTNVTVLILGEVKK